jgi:hypothetical protein
MRLDPTEEEESESECSGVFCYSFGTAEGGEGECVGVDMTGVFNEDQVSFVRMLCQGREADKVWA